MVYDHVSGHVFYVYLQASVIFLRIFREDSSGSVCNAKLHTVLVQETEEVHEYEEM
jgi:hypothetical protein